MLDFACYNFYVFMFSIILDYSNHSYSILNHGKSVFKLYNIQVDKNYI